MELKESKITKQEAVDLYGMSLNKSTLTVNNVVRNRTLLYLSKIFRLYDYNLYNRIKRFKPIAIGIDDCYYNHRDINAIFVLISSKIDISFIKDCPIFETDYIFDDISTAQLRMLVFKFPEEYNDIFQRFLNSTYSEMFTDEQLELIFPTVHDKQDFVYSILKNTVHRRRQFLKLTNTMFKTTLVLNDVSQGDFPIKLENEIFNHGSTI